MSLCCLSFKERFHLELKNSRLPQEVVSQQLAPQTLILFLSINIRLKLYHRKDFVHKGLSTGLEFVIAGPQLESLRTQQYNVIFVCIYWNISDIPLHCVQVKG